MRLKAVQKYVENEEYFLANYTDGLARTVPSRPHRHLKASDKTGLFVSTRPGFTFHIVSSNGDGSVTDIKDVSQVRASGSTPASSSSGRRSSTCIGPGEELVQEPFQRLIARKELITYKYDGFFLGMDTFKEKQLLDDMYTRGETPWEVWKTPPGA